MTAKPSARTMKQAIEVSAAAKVSYRVWPCIDCARHCIFTKIP